MDKINAIAYGKNLADSFIRYRGPLSDQWEHEHGILLKGIVDIFDYTKEEVYFNYLEDSISPLIDDNGTIDGYNPENYFLDDIVSGRVLFELFKNTRDEKYKKAAFKLREQFETHPRASFGNFLHKGFLKEILQIDSIYMGMPFYAQFENEFGEEDYDIVTKSIINADEYNYNEDAGLLYHGYDAKKEEIWADKITGNSSTFWGRGLGWYLAGIIDVLDFLPNDHKDYDAVLGIFRKVILNLLKYQDSSGVWYQVIDQASREGNYKEASASAMFTYCLAKAINKNYLPNKYSQEAIKAYKGLIDEFIVHNEDESLSLIGTCASAGLGVKDYRDGSFESYANEQTRINDLKGVGVFLMASVEIDKMNKA